MSKERVNITGVSWGEYSPRWNKQLDTLRESWRVELLKLDEELPADLIIHVNPRTIEEARILHRQAVNNHQAVQSALSEFKTYRKLSTGQTLHRLVKVRELEFWSEVMRGLRLYIQLESEKLENQIPLSDIEEIAKASRRNLGLALEILSRYITLPGVSPEDVALYLEIEKFYQTTKIPDGSVINRSGDVAI